MLFNSFNFWLVFPLIFVVYWAIPTHMNAYRKIYLILVSYLLYMNWRPVYALVLLFVTVITFWGAFVLSTPNKSLRKKILCYVFSIATLAPLFIFKYFNFINESVFELLMLLGVRFELTGLNWALPVGISFYTFQAIGYMWDVYYERTVREHSFINYLLFCSFFPQTASGPISKPCELLPQIKANHVFEYERGRKGLQMLLWGMFLKVVVADRLGIFVDTVYQSYTHYAGITTFNASIFYTIQIYCDFAGYSLMAVGIGNLLGYDLVNNFNRPYFAATITEFWKRWHISLTRWLTSYVYIPLGGNRCSKLRCYWNIMVTFLVSGLWHGANWTFVIWGGLHGIFQIVEKSLGVQKSKQKGISRLSRIFLTFLLVNFAWILFRSETFGQAIGLITNIISGSWALSKYISDLKDLNPTYFAICLFGIAMLFCKSIVEEVSEERHKKMGVILTGGGDSTHYLGGFTILF